MNVLYLLLYIGAVFVAATLAFYVWTSRMLTFEFAEQLEQLPFESDKNQEARNNEH